MFLSRNIEIFMVSLIEFATDIRSYYPAKQVTLLHSRHRLLPRFDSAMHNESKLDQYDILLG